MPDEFNRTPRIAYFTMEVALRNDIPTYAGGLGVLAGDTLRSAADLQLPMVTVSLISRAGYFRQEIVDGRQVERAQFWDPAQSLRSLNAKVAVNIECRQVWVGAWMYVLPGIDGGRQPVVLLDTDLAENSAPDREITHYLYGGDDHYRLQQEIVLGIGGIKMLQALDFQVLRYHMNEGHSALLGLHLLQRFAYDSADLRPGEPPYDIPRVRALCDFTTHTPVEAGHDRFPYDLVQAELGDYIERPALRHLAGDDSLNMTLLALNLSERVNGVAKRHAEVSSRLFHGSKVNAITNGVHACTWTSEPFRKLYDEYVPGWGHEPELLGRVDCCAPDAAIWSAHTRAKQDLLALVKARTGVALNPELPVIGFARRMTAYKRPALLFADLDRLRAIADRYPLQILLAGKAHPRDRQGKQLIENLHAYMRALQGRIATAFLADYDMDLALAMVSGVDVWLNTPLRPMEASGTSGMKASFNGVPHLSVLDGWWLEGCIEGVTGWAIGNHVDNGGDAPALYQKLEDKVLPLFYENRPGWLAVMKGAISKNAAFFNSHRMMRRYASEVYIR